MRSMITLYLVGHQFKWKSVLMELHMPHIRPVAAETHLGPEVHLWHMIL